MSSTCLDYQDRRVFLPDRVLFVAGYVLFHEVLMTAKSDAEAVRYRKLIEEWERRAIGGGCTDLGLDLLLHDNPDLEQEFLGFVGIARKRIEGFPEDIPRKYYEPFLPGFVYHGDSESRSTLLKVFDLIEALIRGEPVPSQVTF